MPCGITLADSGINRESLLPGKMLFLILVLSAPLLALLTLIMPAVLKAEQNVKSRHKRSGAITGAIRRAKRAKSAAELSQAVRGWFTERLEASGHALTARESALLLADHNVPDEICREISSLIAALDEAMYKPAAESEIPRDRCIEILRKADEALNTAKSVKREDEL
jgi:hypothetical protein